MLIDSCLQAILNGLAGPAAQDMLTNLGQVNSSLEAFQTQRIDPLGIGEGDVDLLRTKKREFTKR